MFSDLVHIELIRLTRSRFFLGGMFALFALFVFANIIYPVLMVNVFTKYDLMVDANGESNFMVQNTLFSINASLVSFFGAMNVIFATCDYYKYKEFINIRGNVRSRAKLSIAEICGILIQSYALVLIPFFATFLSMNYDGASIVFRYPLAALLIYVTNGWSVFNASLVTYAASKLFRRKIVLLALMPVIWVGYSLFFGYVSGFLNAMLGDIGKDLTMVIANPTVSISDILLTSDMRIGVFVAVGLGGLQTLILIVLSVIFSMRKEKI